MFILPVNFSRHCVQYVKFRHDERVSVCAQWVHTGPPQAFLYVSAASFNFCTNAYITVPFNHYYYLFIYLFLNFYYTAQQTPPELHDVHHTGYIPWLVSRHPNITLWTEICDAPGLTQEACLVGSIHQLALAPDRQRHKNIKGVGGKLWSL